MRAGIVAIIFFAAVLAAGHYVAAPMFCRGDLVIPSLDARALCGPDLHFNRQGSVLLYFAAIVIAMFFGLIVAILSGRRAENTDAKNQEKKEEKKKEEKPAETFEQLVVATEKAEAEKAAAEKKESSPVPVAHPSAAVTPSPATAPASEQAAAAATPTATLATPEPTPIVQAPPASASQSAEAAITAALFPAEAKPEAKPEASPRAEIVSSAEAISAAEAITAGLAAKKSGANKPFDGTNEELLERFRELKKHEGVNSIAQAQKLLDESTLAALSKGIDPKQHLSQVAHLVLADDPDLKSGVVRGVVVHVAARLKELGVVNQKFIPPAKSA